MSDNTPEEKPVSETATPDASYTAKREADFSRLTAAQKAYDAVRSEVFPGIEPFIDHLGNEDEGDSSGESGEMIQTACDLAAAPWNDETLRLRAIVLLVRSATRLREMEDAAYRERDATTLKTEEMRLMRQREARDAELTSVARNSAMREAVIQSVVAAYADGKEVDFSSMAKSAADIKVIVDLFLKE